MERSEVQELMDKIHGCTFATLDSETEPSPGILKEETGKRVLLFTNKKISGYEAMVKRRLTEAGKNADDFVIGDLAWGERVPNTALIEHRDQTYLQCVELVEGKTRYILKASGKEYSPEELGIAPKRTNQGLAPNDEVKVRTYNLKHIKRISLMGAVLKVA